MTWWTWLLTAGWGPVSYLEMSYLAFIAATTYYTAFELWDACQQRKVADGRVERWVADGAFWVEAVFMLKQGIWAAIGLSAAVTPPPADAADEPRRLVGALVFTGGLYAVQVVNLVFAGYRRRNRLRITRALTAEATAAPLLGVVPVPGGRRWYDAPPPAPPGTPKPWEDEG